MTQTTSLAHSANPANPVNSASTASQGGSVNMATDQGLASSTRPPVQTPITKSSTSKRTSPPASSLAESNLLKSFTPSKSNSPSLELKNSMKSKANDQGAVERKNTEPDLQTNKLASKDNKISWTDQARRKIVAEMQGHLNEGDLIFGKYKTLEDAAKGYKELETKLGQLTQRAPEQYDAKTAWEKAGVEWRDEFANHDSFKNFVREAKKLGVTQDQFNFFVAATNATLQKVINEITPVADLEAEFAKLKEKYGDRAAQVYNETLQAIERRGWPKELLTKPLMSTALGVELLRNIVEQRKGPSPITDSASVGQARETRINAIDKQIRDLIVNQDYYRSPQGQQEMDKLIAEKLRLTS